MLLWCPLWTTAPPLRHAQSIKIVRNSHHCLVSDITGCSATRGTPRLPVFSHHRPTATRITTTSYAGPMWGQPCSNARSFISCRTNSKTPHLSSFPVLGNNNINQSHFGYPRLSPQLGAVTYFSSSLGQGSGGDNNNHNSNRPPSSSSSSRLAQGAGLVGAASLLLGKGKYIVGALKLTKFASLGSMLLSIGTYSMFFGLPYAAGMVGLILIHETGHALVMLHRNIPFSPMVFMPFVGAVIATRQHPRDAWEDALLALGGPALGSLGAGAVALAAHGTQSQLLFALADFGFMVNLFNLLPIGVLDGGRVASALSPYAGLAGLGLGGLMAYNGMVQNPIFYLILLAGGYETFQRLYNPTAHLPPNYYKITLLQRSVMTASYFGLVAALLAAMSVNQLYRKPPEVLMRERRDAEERSWDMR